MSHPYLPHLDDEDEPREPHTPPEEAGAAEPAPVKQVRMSWKSLPKIGLEVVLISAGVFLGLAGEQWRENRHH